MARKTQERKARLREKLIEIAERRIAEGGIAAVKARDLAREAECAVGAIYTIFTDLNALVLEVNGRSFRKLGDFASEHMQASQAQDPKARMLEMARAYLLFATEHTNLWRALFDLEKTYEGPVPDWYGQELSQLFARIEAPLADLFPELPKEELVLLARAIFSSVHGIVLLGLERRISKTPPEHIERMLGHLIRQIGPE